MIESIPIRIFELIIRGDRLSSTDYDLLVNILRKNNDCFCDLDINTSDANVIQEIVEQRSQLLRLVYPEISHTLALHKIQIDPPSATMPLLWHYWLPLAQSLVHQQEKIGRTFIQGLLGGQGTGKTTLGLVLKILLKYLGKTFLSISLDDLYKTYSDRQKLLTRRPDLIWRGPPSTHDIDLGIRVLQQLRDQGDRQPDQPQLIEIPRFDKSLHHGAGDRTKPEISDGADIVLFEGWFVGMRPLPISAFRDLIPPILSESDRDFALDCNANLYDYLPLWDCLDRLIVLVPEDYQCSLQWRLEAEQQLIASGKTGMSDREITKFVEYFWKALHPELFMPRMIGSSDRLLGAPISSHVKRDLNGDLNGDRQFIDLIVEISRSHIPNRIYRP
jgi:D-glycerate 3-kinase